LFFIQKISFSLNQTSSQFNENKDKSELNNHICILNPQ